jgi:hypothetical protein
MRIPIRVRLVASARTLLCIACPLALLTTTALAQGAAETGTGSGPAATMTAPNTSAVGQTKPPGSAAGPATRDGREARSEQMKRDDKIMKGICVGCGTK